MSTTSYPPTDYTAVLSAMADLTTEFGMESGDPCLHGRAHRRHSSMKTIFGFQRVCTLKVT